MNYGVSGRRGEDTALLGEAAFPPFEKRLLNDPVHRYHAARVRGLRLLNGPVSIVGRLGDGDVLPDEIDVTPFEAEDLADPEAGEETELQAGLVPQTAKLAFVERREYAANVVVRIDVLAFEVLGRCVPVLFHTDAVGRVLFDITLFEKPIEHDAQGDEDVSDGAACIADFDERILQRNDVRSPDEARVLLLNVLFDELQLGGVPAQGRLGENDATSGAMCRGIEKHFDALAQWKRGRLSSEHVQLSGCCRFEMDLSDSLFKLNSLLGRAKRAVSALSVLRLIRDTVIFSDFSVFVLAAVGTHELDSNLH